jgi:hypothetical protein
MDRVFVLEKEVARLTLENEVLREELRLALYRQFAKSSEKAPDQKGLPFEDLAVRESAESIAVVVIAQHERRTKAGRAYSDETGH